MDIANIILEKGPTLMLISSSVGDQGISRKCGFLQAIPQTNVIPFVSANLGLQYGEDCMAILVLREI